MPKVAARIRTVFACAECGHLSPEVARPVPGLPQVEHAARGGRAGASARRLAELRRGRRRLAPHPAARGRGERGGARQRPASASSTACSAAAWCPGALVLLGGDPGIGKSTLLLAALDRLARAMPDRPVLYVSGEESARQVKLRADRLGVSAANLHLLAETDAKKVLHAADALRPAALAVDSIQTQYLPELVERAGHRLADPRGGGAAHGLRQDAPRRRSSSSATSPRTAPSPGRACSSTWWTRSSTSRAAAPTPTASCAPTRTASARPARSASSR